MPFEISHPRLATLDDLPALRILIHASVRGLSGGVYTPEQIESGLRHVFGPDTQLIVDGTYFVIDGGDAKTLIAAGGWSRRRTLYGGDQHKSEVDSVLDPLRDAARIRAFFVHPDWARRGLGRRLFEACVAAVSNAGFRRLELGATLPGLPLYRSLGFIAGAREDVALPDGVVLPIVRMSREISAL